MEVVRKNAVRMEMVVYAVYADIAKLSLENTQRSAIVADAMTVIRTEQNRMTILDMDLAGNAQCLRRKPEIEKHFKGFGVEEGTNDDEKE